MSDIKDFQEEIGWIQHALLIGLDSFGEIERLSNSVETRKMLGHTTPDDLRPRHPTGASDTISDFASALRALECMADQARS